MPPAPRRDESARRVGEKRQRPCTRCLANCLRLTVGSAEENTQMLAALQESL